MLKPFFFSVLFSIIGSHPLWAQLGGTGTGLTVQQPVFSVFNVNTAVGVPDGGTVSLGGISNGAFGETSRGLPLSGAPYLSRAFNNRASGRETGFSNTSVSVKLLIMEELDAQVTAEGLRRAAQREISQPNPNGSAETQRRADFMSRNIGKARKR